jgi:serine/threonine protein kinase
MQVCCTNPNCNLGHKVPDHFLIEPGVSVVVPKCDCGMPLILNRRYIPTRALGHGGFGRTFLASDSNFPGSKRVIKQFSSANLLPMQIEQAENAFERESRILDRLHHPRIPRVFSYFTIRAEPNLVEGEESLSQPVFFYMAQDYVEGQDLQRKLQPGKTYSEKDILILLRQILDVLDYIHNINEPVIHCDIKLSNIIHNSQDDTYHLIDFGAFQRARIIENLSHSSSGIRFASPGFSPPEQYDSNAYASSDLYALGMTCICLLTGNTSPLDLALSEDRGQWKRQAQISPNLAQVLSKMIELKSGDRYRSATDVQQALTLPPTTPLVSSPASSAPIIIRDKLLKKSFEHLARKNPIVSSIIIGIFVLFIAIFAHFYCGTKNLSPEIQIPPQPDRINLVKDVPEGKFNYGGSTTWSGLVSDINIHSFFPSLNLEYKNPKEGKPSSELGISMLINGELDFALSSIALTESFVKEAKNKNIELGYIRVATSGFSMAVNPELKVSELTTTQFSRIYNGEIKNWKEIGGPNLNIHIYATNKNNVGEKAIIIPTKTTQEAFQKVAKDLGGLHISATTFVVGQCGVRGLPIRLENTQNLVSPYKKYVSTAECSSQKHSVIEPNYLKNAPFSRELSVVIVKDGDRKEKAGIAYAKIWRTNQGQEIVSRKGYQKFSK